MTPSDDARTQARRILRHDVNNYLTAELGFVYLLADPRSPEEAAENIESLAQSTRERRRLVADALGAGTITADEADGLASDDMETIKRAVRELYAP